MTKKDVFNLLDLIAEFYEKFEFDQKKLDSWHAALQSFSFEKAQKNLLAFVAVSQFPPKVADLVDGGEGVSRYVPGIQETIAVLNVDQKPASDNVILEELARMRKILGIMKG
ncbi:hypothetical protein ELQ35_15665 [Peribacillus cavernae]|uniref:Replicative helicase inhibitor G39P N-terminal domain-containing protein n=1 Tax=Peribacillus cavernae TaxID=1674310 RepID=A0A433HGJ2_9BACI|nr:hypothetical protein [Peribacillus cavernae]MDQ0221346.1 hypothetical protein [Peribacillus cavernae]RUQ27477.1 hypothetical protein ELQ35_15665 [Peribacillus cavernae]